MKYELMRDDDPPNPREWHQLGTMACFHKKYTLGDKDHGLLARDFEGWTEMRAHLEKGGALVLPIYLYDHSGLRMSTTAFSCPWDSGQIGFIFAPREKILAEYKRKRITPKLAEQVLARLREEVAEYDLYLTGDCWCWRVVNDDGEEIESCCGYFSEEVATQDAKATLARLQHEAA